MNMEERADEVKTVALEILKEMTELFLEEMKGRDGVHLIIWRIGDRYPTISTQRRMNVRVVLERKWADYRVNAFEKGGRLVEEAVERGHVSSWESRDFDNKKYGGAVLAGEWVISCSGLPEKLDEYLTSEIARRFDLMEPEVLEKIISISNNEFMMAA